MPDTAPYALEFGALFRQHFEALDHRARVAVVDALADLAAAPDTAADVLTLHPAYPPPYRQLTGPGFTATVAVWERLAVVEAIAVRPA